MKEPSETLASKLLKGAAILSLAAIFTKLLGTFQKIPLQNIGGDGVFGIYNTVYPFYTLLITLTTSGFQAAVSSFVAERHAVGNEPEQREVLRLAAAMMTVFGVAGAILLYFGAPLLARLIGSSLIVPALQAAAPALLFYPVSAALRGYYQGLQNMVPTAVSQVTEQAVRVTVMIALLLYLSRIPVGDPALAGGALAGSSAGAAASLLVMLLYWRVYVRREGLQGAGNPGNTGLPSKAKRELLRALLKYAIPISLAALAVPLISLVDTFSLPRLLNVHGDEIRVMGQVGIYNRGIPLVQLVTMLATSLSVLFIPAMAELRIKSDIAAIRRQTQTALRWFWLIGLAASVGLALLAQPINVMLYEDAAGSATFAWIAWTAAPSALMVVTSALLQGLGAQRAPALHLFAAALLKAALNALLVPRLGITGAAIASIAAYGAAAALNAALLLRRVGLRPRLRDALLRPAAALLALAAAVTALRLAVAELLPPGRMAAAAESLLGVLLGAAVFAAAVLRTRLLSAAELGALPRIGPKLLARLRKLRLLP
ncbi:polysaccharide biosynthesis protein [Paenibacillus macerans]|uniref:putative polysaccharide biosynthesis protein n=1 Tax=Paenibacillus macerans TaxID=44252 RepID=UPI00203D7223|nr:polysaccharide biosynthesis protein [Paenibacillus macerans]MCM3703873.1 polysaccharide biosynthesis protein [Paenibacillus macerans]